MTDAQRWRMAALLALGIGLGVVLRLSLFSSAGAAPERRDDARHESPPATTPMLPATSLPTIVADYGEPTPS